MNFTRLTCFFASFGLVFRALGNLSPEQIKELPPPASHPVNFEKEIRPILEGSCMNCHGHGRDKGGFRIDTRETLLAGGDSGQAVVPGKSQESLLIALVSGLDPDNIMPAKGRPLTSSQVGVLRAWIDQGVAWPDGGTFARPAPRNLVPRSPKFDADAERSTNPLDMFLEAYFSTNDIHMPALVDDRTFLRRVYLDVIGLLPDAQESRSFLADSSPEKRRALVRRLLSDNSRYAEHWLTFWNDLLRNDYRGTGYIDGGRKQITVWLYSALANNSPYDRFVAELVNPGPQSEGFVKGIVWRGVVNSSQSPPMQAAQNVSQVFMGVNLKCASCHDSFINDWKLADAYGLASVYSDKPLEMFECDKPTGKTAAPAFIYPELGRLDPASPRPERLKRLAEIVTGPDNGRLSRTIVNRLWARFLGHGLVEPVDDMEKASWYPDLLDWLSEDLVAHKYDLKHTIERILTSRAYQLPAIDLGEAAPKPFVFRGPGVRRMTAEQFRDALGQIAGVWHAKSEFSGRTNDVRASLVAADPLAVALGRPNREQVNTTRPSAATTLQALELTNGKTLAGVLARGAERVVSSNPERDELIQKLFAQALGRPPTEKENASARELVGQPPAREGVEDLLWVLAMLPEFQLLY